MKDQVDLHVHTTASDGDHTPTQVVKLAKKLGLKAIAIADHDTTDWVEEALRAGKKHGLEVIPGVEISSYWQKGDNRGFHICGLFIDPGYPKLQTTLKHFQKVRVERAKKIVKALQKEGYRITYQQVKKKPRLIHLMLTTAGTLNINCWLTLSMQKTVILVPGVKRANLRRKKALNGVMFLRLIISTLNPRRAFSLTKTVRKNRFGWALTGLASVVR